MLLVFFLCFSFFFWCGSVLGKVVRCCVVLRGVFYFLV